MRVFVNLDYIKDNVNTIRNYTSKEVIAVVKSNAYGLGVKRIVKTLLETNVDYFFFNKLSEYLEVKELLQSSNVIIFESLSLESIEKHYTCNLILTINNYHDLLVYEQSNKTIRVHIQVDTGMNRVGIRSIETVKKIISEKSKNIIIEGLYTHYATNVDEYQFFALQQEKFLKYVSLYDFKVVHSNATSSLHKNVIGNMVRVGMGIYGYHSKLPLKHAVTCTTKLINVFNLACGEHLGYEGKYTSKGEEVIGVVDLGYYDSSIIDKVYINNKAYKFIGKTCMNHVYIKLDNEINYLSHLRIFKKFDIIDNDDYDYYKLLTSFDHLKKNYIERI